MMLKEGESYSFPSSDGRLGTGLPPPDTSSCATAKKLSVQHEPPRWRFINRAKKTEGYSSVSAGYIVKGACIYASSRPRFQAGLPDLHLY